MQFLAAATTTADKLKDIPTDFWLKLLLAMAAFVVAIIFLRKVAKMNKVVLTIVVVILLTTVGFNWVFERNEPKWATPAVTWLGGFFPNKGSYTAKQQTTPPSAAPSAAKRI